jgi:Domain of unknown function (DUF4234)
VAQELLIADGRAQVKRRNPWGVFGLTLITLGIYILFWWYYVNREMRDYGRATGNDLGQNPTNSLLALFPGSLIIIPPLISYWRGTKRIQETQTVAGASPLNGWIALILFLLIQIAFAPYLQSSLNSAWDRAATTSTGGPAGSVTI